jgi:hypothetical protein
MPLTAIPATTPAWIVCAWEPILWQTSRTAELCLEHRTTRVSGVADGGACTGQTLWTVRHDREAAGVAWDWIEIRDGVVAMADPLGLVTNLRLVDDRGETLDEVSAAMRLHAVVHALGWQRTVAEALRKVERLAA